MEQMTQMNLRMDEIQDFFKMNVQPTTDNKNGKQVSFSDQLSSQVMNHDHEVVNCTWSCVKIKSKLTNLIKISRIKWYNGKYGSNPQGIREISDYLFEFDQIGQ